MTYDTIIFDNDGVLVDTEILFFQSCVEILQTVDVQLDLPTYQDMSLRQGKSTMALATSTGLNREEIEQLRLKRDVIYRHKLSTQLKVRDGVSELLKNLHGRIKMGVVTSTTKEHFNLIHQQADLLPFFDFVITQEDCPRLKPYPDPYLIAVEQAGLDAKKCIIVEDSERGLLSANAAGINCVITPTTISANGDYSTALRVYNNILEIMEFFQSL